MKSILFCFASFGILLLLIACEPNEVNLRDEFLTDNIIEETLPEDCFEFVYPLELQLPDGDVLTANSDADLEALFGEYAEEEEYVMFVFPVSILDTNGEELTLSGEAFYEFLDHCEDGYEDTEEECVQLVYPVNIELPDGSIVELENEAELDAIYEGLEDADEELSFQFPITVLYDGVELNVSEAEFEELENSCDEELSWYLIFEGECFDFVYPIFLTMPNGDVLNVDDATSIEEVLEAWYIQHPDAAGDPVLNYPVDLVFDEIDLAYTANDEEELWEAFEYCEEDVEHDDDFLNHEDWCFDLVLPVSLEMPDGSELEVGLDQELSSAIENWYAESDQEWDGLPELIFPLSILFDDGSELELLNGGALEEAIEDCE